MSSSWSTIKRFLLDQQLLQLQSESSSPSSWKERRLRLAQRRFGGVKEELLVQDDKDEEDEDHVDFALERDVARSAGLPGGGVLLPQGQKPSFITNLKQLKSVLRDEARDSSDGRRALGLGLLGKLTQRELNDDAALANGPAASSTAATASASPVLIAVSATSTGETTNDNDDDEIVPAAVAAIEQPQTERSNSDESLLSDPDFRPYFTYWLCFVHVFVAILAVSINGLGPFGFGLSQSSGLTLTEWLTMELVTVQEPSNIWVGPRLADLVRLGANFAPCMRSDKTLTARLREEMQLEANSTGCCVRNDRSGCFQTVREDCSPILSTFYKWGASNPGPGGRTSGPVCSLDPQFCSEPVSSLAWPDDIGRWPVCSAKDRRASEAKTKDEGDEKPLLGAPKYVDCQVVARPCCIGIHGRCELKSKDYCDWVRGTFHPDASLCSQVNCLGDVCGLLPFFLFSSSTPDQLYRLWTSLFLHAGLVHALISVVFQMFFLRDVEKLCGPFRIAVIFFSSGIVGNLVSAMFTPYRPQCGPSGSIFGVIGALVAEVVLAWSILRRPLLALLQLSAALTVLFLLGFLPWVDNYAHVAGFVTGLAVSWAILPREPAMGERTSVIPRALLAIFFFLLGLSLLLVFILVPLPECERCKLFSCIPFTTDFCSEMNINFERKRRLF